MADSYIKPDPESFGASPAATDDDIYEDAGDLEFNISPENQQLLLARLPTYMWEAWSKLSDDAEIQIGTIRASTVNNRDGTHSEKFQMLLNPNIPQHQTVPKEYELENMAQNVKNTFVFTEQDLPGYKSKSRMKFDPATANMPSRLNKPKIEKQGERQPFDKNRRFQPYYKKAIPKKTTLAGRVTREMNCVAVMNAEAERILTQRTLDQMKPKFGTKFINEDLSTAANGFIQPGMEGHSTFDRFIKTARPKTGKAAQEAKTARMPQNELLDLIFQCFRKHKYWSMRAFREELRQPEAYLRETLEKVADLVKSGRFTGHWTLKPENSLTNYEMVEDTIAPTGANGSFDSDMGEENDEEDDDENVKMEDVLPQ